jgi:hypothetical protein
MRFAADYSETLEDPHLECDLGYSSGHAPQNMARARISSGRSLCYQGSPHRGLLRSVKNFQSFTVICRKPHMASSICLRTTILQNPEGTLWTHCTKLLIGVTEEVMISVIWIKNASSDIHD